MARPILIVDDESHIVQVLSLKLRNAGYEVITAGDGEEGLEKALRELPSLVITDFHMPYMTGVELCRALADNDATCAIPILMLTARGHALDPDDLALGNIRDVLSKPFSPRAIVEYIQRILGGGPTSSHSATTAAPAVKPSAADAHAARPADVQRESPNTAPGTPGHGWGEREGRGDLQRRDVA